MQTNKFYGRIKSNQRGFGQPLSLPSPGLSEDNDLFSEGENEQAQGNMILRNKVGYLSERQSSDLESETEEEVILSKDKTLDKSDPQATAVAAGTSENT